jgi:Flp pilus assembly protein TadG
MRCRFGSDAKRGRHGERGSIAVEFAIILPLLLLLVLGGMDLGHRYYMQYLISNASREGARYAAKYRETLVDPNSSAISDYVKLPAGLNYNSLGLDTLVVSGSYTGVSPNKIITVTVNANKYWWALGSLLGFTNPQTITATTAMAVER